MNLGVVEVQHPNDIEYIYGSVKPGPNRYPMDTREKIENLAHILEHKYGFDTACAFKQVDKKTGKVNFYGIGVDVITQKELDRFIEALKEENPKVKNIEIGEVGTQINGKKVPFVTWEE